MSKLPITDETAAMLSEMKRASSASNVTHNADGTVTVPVSDDTLARINALRREGETDNDVLRRVLLQNGAGVMDGNRRNRAIIRKGRA